VNIYLSQVISSNASSNEEPSNYVLEPWLLLLNAEVEEVEGCTTARVLGCGKKGKKGKPLGKERR